MLLSLKVVRRIVVDGGKRSLILVTRLKFPQLHKGTRLYRGRFCDPMCIREVEELERVTKVEQFERRPANITLPT
jgi:hypothetical protein